ncbi:MAG: xanthine dehydrogenase family protein molybdopterin-binding subunit, partial [Rhodospirillaceae bacterium]|nr:xanthine dehydrogenase family protein molybdopterin-binding subunit [Rhodospirillaceae bacterium]
NASPNPILKNLRVIGQHVRRKEDVRLLTGHGRFTDDFSEANQVFAVIIRSPHAHAVLGSINAARAQAMPGVLGVFFGEDMKGLGEIAHDPLPKTKFDLKLHAPGGSVGDPVFLGAHALLPTDKVRFVGEAVAMVVAETKAQANDAAEAVDITYAPLPAVTATAEASQPDAPRLWDEIPDNVAIETFFGDPTATDAAFAKADHKVGMSFNIGRVTGVPMEPRSALAVHDAASNQTTLYAGSGGVVRQKREIATVLCDDPETIRVVAYDVGGNFGTRNRVYVEFGLAAWAARRLERPVKFTAMRSESFISDYQGRDLLVNMSLALDSHGNFLGLRASNLSNLGARCVSLSPLSKGSGIITGSYNIPTAHLRSRAVFSNTPPTNAYRSSGRPEVIFAIERLIDTAAAELGMDPVALRRRNFVTPDQMPYTNAVGMTYDSGEYEAALDKAMALADWDGFTARRATAMANGKRLGRGLAHYVESSIGSPIEQAQIHVRQDLSGLDEIHVVIGTQPSGQGHETSFAQVAAEWLGIPIEQVRIVLGDTNIVEVGGGSHSGRSMRMAGTVIVKAADAFIAKGKRLAADILEAAVSDIDFGDGRFFVTGTDRGLTIFELAAKAPDNDPLSAVESNEMHTPVFPNGCHVCEVEVDPETGHLNIQRYTAIDDVGRAINPLIVDGQTHGGIVQGVGQAMWEQCVFDEHGQPLSGSFMDYGMPRALHFPSFKTALHEVPSPTNPLGVKAGGEGGTTPALAVIVNAVVDALREPGIDNPALRDLTMPLTPEKIWRAAQPLTNSKNGKTP